MSEWTRAAVSNHREGGSSRPTDGPGPRRSSARVLLAILLFAASYPAGPAVSQQRLIRTYDARDGLSSPTVFSLAQDSTGFLWVGTIGGLYRYDGSEMKPWAPDRIQGRVRRIVVAGARRVAVLEETGTLWRVEGGGARRVGAPDGGPVEDARDVAPGANGTLWVLRGDDRIWRLRPGGAWEAPLGPADVGGETPRHLFAGPDGALDVATDGGLWSLPAGEGGSPGRIVSLSPVVDVLPLPDGRRILLTFWREAFLLEDGRLERLLDVPGRGIDLALRGDVVWVSYDRYLARVESGRPPRILGPRDGIEAGGPLLVDHEGSLWMGTFMGLDQFPEPETRWWADRDGLPSAHARFLARTGDTLWVTTWQGAARLVHGQDGWRADTVRAWFTRSDVLTDDEGDLWAGTADGLVEVRPGRPARVVDPEVQSLSAGTRGGPGELWLGVRGQLLRVRAENSGKGDGATRVDTVPGLDAPGDTAVRAVLQDSDDRLWVAAGGSICRAPAAAVRAGEAGTWRCWRFPGVIHFTALAETQAGSIWASSPYAGVLRFREGEWEPLAAVSSLPSRSVLNLVRSPRGGLWVLGHGILLRVRPDPSAEGGWRVLERLSTWHGLPTPGGADLLEDADGSLWITTSRGLVRVPAGVRRSSPSPPRVALVEARADDRVLPLGGRPELPHDRNRLELRFAALSYRAPTAVRYRVRLGPGSEWSDARSQPVVRWVDVSPGEHRAEVRASLDGDAWSEPPATFAFDVLPPWYLEPRWLAVLALAAVLAGLTAYRMRVAHLVGLERQRTRIAMDLHDQMGSALGSIGIQAALLSRPGVHAVQRARLARDIADTADDLGTTLADIVWSLDPRGSRLDDLALRLEERGRKLFAGGDATLSVRHPRRWPESVLPASVRRNVLLVGLEALRNAAVHAEADAVEMSLGEVSHGVWRLTVRDDGRGVSPADVEESEGMGLLSMRKRAGEMGGKVEWRRPAGGGTEVALTFPLRGRRRLGERAREIVASLVSRMNMLLRRDD